MLYVVKRTIYFAYGCVKSYVFAMYMYYANPTENESGVFACRRLLHLHSQLAGWLYMCMLFLYFFFVCCVIGRRDIRITIVCCLYICIFGRRIYVFSSEYNIARVFLVNLFFLFMCKHDMCTILSHIFRNKNTKKNVNNTYALSTIPPTP